MWRENFWHKYSRFSSARTYMYSKSEKRFPGEKRQSSSFRTTILKWGGEKVLRRTFYINHKAGSWRKISWNISVNPAKLIHNFHSLWYNTVTGPQKQNWCIVAIIYFNFQTHFMHRFHQTFLQTKSNFFYSFSLLVFSKIYNYVRLGGETKLMKINNKIQSFKVWPQFCQKGGK